MAASAMATDQLDVSVGLKTLPLLTPKITGPATVAIVFDPSNAESKADADAIKAVIDGGLEAPGGVKLVALMVAVGEIGKVSGAKIAILTRGAGKSAFDGLATAATAAGVLSMSTDLDCVKASKCVLGIQSKPSVDIYFSKAAADAAKLVFSPAFAMLAKQI
jgi:hypothetical protein